MAILIRKMTKGDIPKVQRVAETSWQTTYEGIIPTHIQESFLNSAYSDAMMEKRLENTLFLIAEDEGEIIGFANFSVLKDETKVELGAIYLYKEYQGQGIGTALLKEGVKHLEGVKKIYINVEKENLTGISFYKAKGFEIETVYDDVFNGHVLKTARMVLKL
jgi:ribosomal protein S18 acetylase RimI-like enzyme